MAYLKTETITQKSTEGFSSFKVKINVDAKGDFYCLIPDYLYTPIQGVEKIYIRDRSLKVFSNSLVNLVTGLHRAYQLYLKPDIKEEYVIQYYIGSFVHFAEDKEGNVFPNANFDGVQWATRSGGRYDDGDHCSMFNKSYGYSLNIGAAAKIKITETFGDASKITYKNYYKDGRHGTSDNPAVLLNSWVKVVLPDEPKEIPYTDEAATFFHNLMLGMTKLSQQIQSHVFDQDSLLAIINSGTNLLGNDTKQE